MFYKTAVLVCVLAIAVTGYAQASQERLFVFAESRAIENDDPDTNLVFKELGVLNPLATIDKGKDQSVQLLWSPDHQMVLAEWSNPGIWHQGLKYYYLEIYSRDGTLLHRIDIPIEEVYSPVVVYPVAIWINNQEIMYGGSQGGGVAIFNVLTLRTTTVINQTENISVRNVNLSISPDEQLLIFEQYSDSGGPYFLLLPYDHQSFPYPGADYAAESLPTDYLFLYAADWYETRIVNWSSDSQWVLFTYSHQYQLLSIPDGNTVAIEGDHCMLANRSNLVACRGYTPPRAGGVFTSNFDGTNLTLWSEIDDTAGHLPMRWSEDDSELTTQCGYQRGDWAHGSWRDAICILSTPGNSPNSVMYADTDWRITTVIH